MMERGESFPADIATAAGKAAPPIAVAGATIAGMTLQDWVMVTTIVYTVLQTAWLLWRIFFGQRAKGGGHGQAD